MSAFEAAFEALRKTVGDVEADRLLTAVENERLRIRAAALIEAAEEIEGIDFHPNARVRSLEIAQGLARRLRRLASSPSPAAGDKQPETEAHPRRVSWSVELYDPLAKEWALGLPFLAREKAVERLNAVSAMYPKWADDGTPVKRRLVRETTTYTVEAGDR
ncbi:hypothetical protein [Streptomyces sp. NPDC059165]|uniref:hypothetical protein n=1 Tax=Streptomyces sp. NPDC059165 TaxID=3346751 RepID=UPI0036C03265